MDPAVVTLCVLAVACFLFVTELIPLAVTAMAACTALGILGVLPSKQVYAGLSNSTVVLFGGMFVIGAAMFRTGLAQAIGVAVVKKAGTNEVPLMGAVMLVTIVLSSVSSNTGTVACLMPVVIGICQAAKISQSRQLMPLAIAAMSGTWLVPAFLTTATPIASARPVLNMAAPMTNIPPKRTTVELDKPA